MTELLGRDVDVAPGAPVAPTPDNPATFAVFVDDTLQISAVIVVDLNLSAYAGTSIGLIPATTAEEAIKEKVLAQNVRDNLYEVLNIASAMFNIGDARHMKLYDVHYAGDPIPPAILAKGFTLGQREDLTVTIGGYGSGKISTVLV
jgi:hypothetical protein